MNNQDNWFLKRCIKNIKTVFPNPKCEFPLDEEIEKRLQELKNNIRENSDDFEIYRFKEKTDELWELLLKKAIICLRYYDTREPFIKNNKTPKAYGINELKEYYNNYIEFEKVLYGAGKYYRDHVIHVFRTWLTGVWLLTKNKGDYINRITISESGFSVKTCSEEKISIWTIIALTHDLGYPLEKSKEVIDVTQKMVSTFVSNPNISLDFSFHGVQNFMNDFVVRLMSSKMRIKSSEEKEIEDDNGKKTKKVFNTYVARLQPKYYFKFQKSLEKNKHGILSTLIIYKLLTYFLESDYSINEDYCFDEDDCRQFYIRREILRSIASHTCNDVYQLYMNSFAFLLRICDDTQEWGRKNISELYIKSGQEYSLDDISLSDEWCKIKETIKLSGNLPNDVINNLIRRFYKQATVYVTIFRDGQDTIKRDFSFSRETIIEFDKVKFELSLKIPKESASALTIQINYTSDETQNKAFNYDFIKKIKYVKEKTIEITTESDKKLKVKDIDNNEYNEEQTWRKGYFELCL